MGAAHTADAKKKAKEGAVAALFSCVTVLGVHTVDVRNKVKEGAVLALL